MTRKITLFAAALGAVLAIAAAPAFATDPLPGVDVSLGQVPGGIVASGPTSSSGTVAFFNLPEGRYQISLDTAKIRVPAVMTVQAGRDAAVACTAIAPARRGASGAAAAGLCSSGSGGAMTFVIAPGPGTAKGAKPKAASGQAPRDANPLSTIVVTLTSQ